MSPEEVEKTATAHPGIIRVVNELLQLHYKRDGTAIILQKHILHRFLDQNPDYTKERVKEEKLMDFESAFERVGWNVAYDKPGYNEAHYDAFFTFTKNKR